MDGTSFTNIINASNQNGSVDLYDRLANIKARYIRLNATQPNIFYYRLTEFEVYTSDCDCKITTTDSNNSYKQIPIKLYPVPANNYISYSIPSQYLMKDIYLQIISAEGKIVYNTRTTATSDVIPLQQLRPSTYYFKITVNKEVGITKFVKI